MTKQKRDILQRKGRGHACHICYTIDYRSDDTNTLTIMMRGVREADAEAVFAWLGAGGNTFGHYIVKHEFDVLRRNGFCTKRLAIRLDDFNHTFCSVAEFCLLVEARFKAQTSCTIRRLTMERFLNV